MQRIRDDYLSQIEFEDPFLCYDCEFYVEVSETEYCRYKECGYTICRECIENGDKKFNLCKCGSICICIDCCNHGISPNKVCNECRIIRFKVIE